MKWMQALCALGLALSSSACAAMFDGTKSEVTFSSEPSGASVEFGGETRVTPFSAKISKKLTACTFRHPEYPEHVVEWKRNFQTGYFFMDLLFTPGFGISGFIVDGSTAAWYDHPNMIHYDFRTQVSSVDKDEKAKKARESAEPVAASAPAPSPQP